jgi:hypothetical protein
MCLFVSAKQQQPIDPQKNNPQSHGKIFFLMQTISLYALSHDDGLTAWICTAKEGGFGGLG